ncbi:phenol 2-monooxygenase protein [Rutstroemia sp. NJR-2017a BBW]|nr:phenol 2-monooxygenase protein [Rutstroemia sp. NJR-2017a BBW]
MDSSYDVLIIGSGSAGLAAGVWLSQYPDVKFKILEKRSGPLEMGQADGVQCRMVEICESFDLADILLKEGYWVNEVAFWAENSATVRLERTGTAADTPYGLSHQPHLILNQARINQLLIEKIGGDNIIKYGVDVQKIACSEPKSGDPYCVGVVAQRGGKEQNYRAKYVIGSDGAHSSVRRSLGFTMIGDSSDVVWGVMDVIPDTDFPDIRKKATIRTSAGNVLNIPREGGAMNRLYIELPRGTVAKDVTLANLQDLVREVFAPFRMEIKHAVWWSAYTIGQRVASSFHQDYRVFLAGDACHTHSPKAGQGMNVSFQDGFNLGWKLGEVLSGLASTDLLQTYVLERQKTAQDLIDFDRYFSSLFSKRDEAGAQEEFRSQFIKAARYTAGVTATYAQSCITKTSGSEQELATCLGVGARCPSAQVVRFCDVKPVQFHQALKADGKWRLVVFCGDISKPILATKLQKLAQYLSSNPGALNVSSYVPGSNCEAQPVLVISGSRAEIDWPQIPSLFTPIRGSWGIRDLHQVYVDDVSYNHGHGYAYKKFGIDADEGAIVLIRPDQHIARLLSLDVTKAPRATSTL